MLNIKERKTEMISPVLCDSNKNLSNFSMKKTFHSNPSFSQKKVDKTDEFEYVDNPCKDNIELSVYAQNDVHLLGTLAGKDYNVRLKQKNPQNKKDIEITGYYNHKKIQIRANYKNNNHHYYKGTYNGENFELEHKIGGLFTKDCLKGKINEKQFCAKFPSASVTDANKDLMLLLLHLSGYITDVDGYNFSVTEPSELSFSYFSGMCKDVPPNGTLLDSIWKDPVFGSVSV